MTDKELLQQALDALTCAVPFGWSSNYVNKHRAATEALRARLAQPDMQIGITYEEANPPEPKKLINVNGVLEQAGYVKKKEWVGLTDEEIFGIFGTYIGDPDYNHNKLLLDARRIEAKLKEKNNG